MAPVSEIFLTVQSSLGALSLKTIEALFNTRLRGAVRLSFMAAFRLQNRPFTLIGRSTPLLHANVKRTPLHP